MTLAPDPGELQDRWSYFFLSVHFVRSHCFGRNVHAFMEWSGRTLAFCPCFQLSLLGCVSMSFLGNGILNDVPLDFSTYLVMPLCVQLF